MSSDLNPLPQDINTPSVNAPQNPQVVKLNSSKLITLMFILIVLLLGTNVYLFFQNNQLKSQIAAVQTPPTPIVTATPNPTADWKTYINKYGFSFKYPPEWQIKALDPERAWFTNIRKGHTLRTFVGEVTGFGYCYKYGKEEITIVDGEEARTADGVGGTDMCTDLSITKESGNTYVLIPLGKGSDTLSPRLMVRIDYDYPLSDLNLAKDNLNQILSTFKFTESSGTNLKSQVEDVNSYKLDQTKLFWDKCIGEPTISATIKDTLSKSNVFIKEIDGVRLAYTQNSNFTSDDVSQFTICEAGSYSPIYSTTDYIFWIGSCSTGVVPDNLRCEETLTKIKQLYK